jgi:hypothetical protein
VKRGAAAAAAAPHTSAGEDAIMPTAMNVAVVRQRLDGRV